MRIPSIKVGHFSNIGYFSPSLIHNRLYMYFTRKFITYLFLEVVFYTNFASLLGNIKLFELLTFFNFNNYNLFIIFNLCDCGFKTETESLNLKPKPNRRLRFLILKTEVMRFRLQFYYKPEPPRALFYLRRCRERS